MAARTERHQIVDVPVHDQRAAEENGARDAKHGGALAEVMGIGSQIRDLPLAAVDAARVTRILEPIWTEKAETYRSSGPRAVVFADRTEATPLSE